MVSSWYDPSQKRAFTTININEVPDDFKSKLIQHSASLESSVLMYPYPNYVIKHIDTGKMVCFNKNPSFTGSSFKIWWDVKNKPDQFEEFSSLDPISNHPHEYDDYGEYVVAFSTNVTALNMNQMLAAQFKTYSGNNTSITPYFSIASKVLQLNQIPYFEGDQLSIQWEPGYTQTYTHDSSLEEFQHSFSSFGEKPAITMQSDGNYVSVDVEQMFPDEQGLVFIKSISSRNPAHTSINNLAFCRSLRNIKCSKLARIATQWYDCYELTSIYLPELTSIDMTYAVNCMPNLKEIYAPRLKSITNATSTFKGNTGIESISFPELSSISGRYSTFSMNCMLSSVEMPSLISCNNQCFEYCVNLKDVDFLSLLSSSTNMFKDNISLEQITLPKIKYIAAYTFNRCQNLQTIDLSRLDEVPELANINAFTGLPANYKVLVKNSMLSQFKAATNWKNATVINHITGI